jgi:hypothetical protein
LTGGLSFLLQPSAQNGNSPWHLEIGTDNNLYIADFSTNNGSVYRTGPDVNNGEQVLDGKGQIAPDANLAVHTTIGGSPISKSPISRGSPISSIPNPRSPRS